MDMIIKFIINLIKDYLNKAKSLPVKEDKRIFTQPEKKLDESKIKVDYSVTNKWHKGWKRPLDQITEAVVHHTAGSGTWQGLRDWMLSVTGKRKANYKRGIGLFPFVIQKNGTLAKFGPIARWWYHSHAGKHDSETIGIEIIHNKGSFSKQQYETLFWLLFEYIPFHCENYKSIVSHDHNMMKYTGKKKSCPGPDFEWAKLEKEMGKRKISWNFKSYRGYNIALK